MILEEWLDGFHHAEVNWTSSGEHDSMVYHQVQLVNPAPFQEYESQASDGTVYYVMPTVSLCLPSYSLQRPEPCS